MSIYEDLEWRGLIADCTDAGELSRRLGASPITLYAGFDPTSDSLHLGNLVPLLALHRFQLAGHHPIAVAGGGTGSIGDPSGRTAERQLLSVETIESNISRITEQLRSLLDFERSSNPARVLNNASWTHQVSYLDFLRDIGKHFSVNMMVAKESVRARMEDRDSGISYTEFSYMLLQAFDFYVLRRDHQCDLQIGGSDQWGNITAGIDLCRKKLGASVFGLTHPLIMDASGVKFGKTVAGAVWLDSKKTSVYRFYQFWIRSDDRDVIRLLKYFTFLPREEIEALETQHREKPEGRAAHKALAWEVTRRVHGESAGRDAIRASEILFGGSLEGITENHFKDVTGEVPSFSLDHSQIERGIALVDLLVASKLSSSKGQARKEVEGGGVYLNNQREGDPQRRVGKGELLFEKYFLLRKGKRNYSVFAVA